MWLLFPLMRARRTIAWISRARDQVTGCVDSTDSERYSKRRANAELAEQKVLHICAVVSVRGRGFTG